MRWVWWFGLCLWPRLARGAVSASDLALEGNKIKLSRKAVLRERRENLAKAK
jgi:hypothetical protein